MKDEDFKELQEYYKPFESLEPRAKITRLLKLAIEEKKSLDVAKKIIKGLLIVYQEFNQTDTYIRAERFLKENE